MKRQVLRLLRLTIGERATTALAIRLRRFRYRLALSLPPPLTPTDQLPFPKAGTLPLFQALAHARSLPGSLTDQDLEQLYLAGEGVHCACWFGADAEAAQAATMLYAGGAKRVDVMEPHNESQLDLVVMQRGATIPDHLTVPPRVRRLKLESDERCAARCSGLRQTLKHGGRLRVLLLNDVGFQYGAGVATRRQAQSFLLAGWDVALISWDPGTAIDYPTIAKLQPSGRWMGVRSLPHAHHTAGMSDAQITAVIVQAVREVNPDFVLVGNIHGAKWPIAIMPALQATGLAVAAYMHDLHWVTGRCAYPGPCRAYIKEGCDADCPTAEEYPALQRERIAEAWARRAEVFTGPNAIPLIANSNWTRDIARLRFGDKARIETAYLGLDTLQFRRMDRALARRLLGIAFDGPLVLMGSVNVKEERKGGPVFMSVLDQLHSRGDVGVLVFGHGSEALPCTKGFGLVTDEREMAVIYSAADIFVSTAREEAFGQTLLEASSSGMPVVAFKVGGVSEATLDGTTALLLNEVNDAAILSAINQLLANPALAARLGANGLARSASDFGLQAQADTWKCLLGRLF